ncbi:MAG: peptide deformylase [Propionibacteriaceae bacterium]|jgi:peptide deformylase|nr:peptide deformylase [Propionibacteriaceae bacterium]
MPTVRDWNAMGNVRRITTWDEPVMHTETQPVREFGDELRQLVADMFATMAAADGVGLAAPQVGVDLALFVYHCPDEDDRFQHGVVCNPVVELPEGDERNFDASQEGCLSWPGAYQLLSRPDYAICSGQDENGAPVVVRGTGLLARCLQHETDHLHGTVFGDRLSARSRRKLNAERESKRHLYPADWPIHPKGRETGDNGTGTDN